RWGSPVPCAIASCRSLITITLLTDNPFWTLAREEYQRMPTDEFKPLLDRAKTQRAAQQLIDLACPLLREVVNKAAWIFDFCNTEGSHIGEENEDLAAMTLYRHMIELVDGIEVLFSVSCVDASGPLLRAEYEALLSLDYIFKADYARRSLCWACGYTHARIDAHRRLDQSTDMGAEFAAGCGREGDGHADNLVSHDSAQAVAALRSVLAREKLRPIEAEYQRL